MPSQRSVSVTKSSTPNNGVILAKRQCRKCWRTKLFSFHNSVKKLRTSKRGTVFVESAFSGKWGSGLYRKGTLKTKQSAWPGENKTGEIMTKIAKTVRKRKKSDQWSKPRQSQSKKETSSQRNIASMLRDMRNQSETSDLSGYNESDADSSEDATSTKNSLLIS